MKTDDVKVGMKVRIKDHWVSSFYNHAGKMDHWLGQTMTVAHIDSFTNDIKMIEDADENGGFGWYWCAEDFDPVIETDCKIVITAHGNQTLARLFDGKRCVRAASARCHPDDEFNFDTGAALAFSRLMQKQKTLADFSPGDTIIIADYDFIVLEHDEKGTLIILKDLMPARKFDFDSSNWTGSGLREWLYHCDLYQKIKNELTPDSLISMRRDLTSMDGLSDYGAVDDHISLLTFDEYRKYHTILGLKPNNSDWWWLVTPASTPSNGYSRRVCFVDECGIPLYGDCSSGHGVRPVLKLKSSILIKKEEQHES